MSAFPSMLEYQEVIQNPGTCFSEPELAGGTVVVDALGLPKPITGGFASVYQVKTKKKHFAVRCFLRSHAGVQDRYARISDFQRQHRPKWMAEFVYIAQGMKVRGQWYPVLKMEWIQGEQLNVHLDKLAGNKKAIKALGEKFLALIEAMAKLGVAHGDLQHGNILVAGGELKLIDYDAMYVPGMTGRSHEVGHRNFQHPKRSEREFGPDLDNFSAWVISLSLRALALAPDLWRELDGGDEGLLLRKEDFLKPDESKALKAIERIADASLQRDLVYLKQCLAGDPAAVISPLKRQAAVSAPAQPVVSAPAPALSRVVSAPAATVSTPVPAKTQIVSRQPASPAASASVQPLTTSGPPERLAASVTAERSIFGLALATWAGLGVAFWQQLIPDIQAAAGAGAMLAFMGLFFLIRYASLPQVRRLRTYMQEHQDVSDAMVRSETRSKALAAIDASFATTRRLDFDALTDQIDTREGKAVLASIMEYLEDQALTKAQIGGVTTELAKKLARRGLKSALRLQDVVVSRSMAEGEVAESITVLLQNGKGLSKPVLTRPEAEALLAWRSALEKQFVTTASGEERLRYDGFARRAKDLEAAIELHADVNGWRFLGLVFGLS